MFHERVAVPVLKLNINCTSDGVMPDDGTSRYTNVIKTENYKFMTKRGIVSFQITVLSGILAANNRRNGCCSANHESI